MKIFMGGIATETNTYSPLPTGIDDFLVQRGRDVVRGHVPYPSLDLTRVWGTRAVARGDQFIFGLNAWAEPAGMTVRSAYESLRDELLGDLRAAMPVDIVLLMLHGAMVADGYEDCEQDLLGRVRHIVGPGAVIGVEFDLHCHLAEAKIAGADVVITFKEYPHIDINERAAELFDLAVATRLGKVRPTMALFDCRMIGFYPTTRQPLRQFVDSLTEAEGGAGVLSVSFGHGFAFADSSRVGAKMLVVTDNDPVGAVRLARELGIRAHALRRDIGFESISLSMEDALAHALQSERTPVVVADQSDNIGGGAPGDATFALKWLLDHDATGAAIAILYDPEVVRIAKKAGVGARVQVRLGGKLSRFSGDPVDLDVTVIAAVDNYMHARPQLSGEPLFSPLGDVVALRCQGVDVVVSSKRCQCYCPSVFADLGIDPTSKQLLMPKSMQHFYEGFARIAGDIIYMAGPGAVAPDPRRIPYQVLDTSTMYPWNDCPLDDTDQCR